LALNPLRGSGPFVTKPPIEATLHAKIAAAVSPSSISPRTSSCIAVTGFDLSIEKRHPPFVNKALFKPVIKRRPMRLWESEPF